MVFQNFNTNTVANLKRITWRFVLMTLLFAANSWLVIGVATNSNGMAAIWSANAILIVAVLNAQRFDTVPLYAGAFVASVAANYWAGFDVATIFSFSIANIAEVLAVKWIFLNTRDPQHDDFAPGNLARFVAIALVVPALSATIAVTGLSGSVQNAWTSWYLSDSLGLLVLVPSLGVLQKAYGDDKSIHSNIKHRIYGISIVVLVAITSAAALYQDNIPILFVVAIPVLIAAFQLGAVGAIAAVWTVAVIAICATLSGYGPIHQWTDETINHIYLLQGFLACQLLVALPVASVLEDRNRKAAALIEQERILRVQAERSRRSAETIARRMALLATRDELTTLSTRGRILQRLEHAANRQTKLAGKLAIAIFDIDNFKSINDQFGHLAGDDVLRMVGRVSRQTLPMNFDIGRIGGEEFMVIMPGQSKTQASAFAELLRLAIMQGNQNQGCPPATISIGLAVSQDQHYCHALTLAADKALYAAKSNGRNRLQLAA